MVIIGVDCSADPRKTGIALGRLEMDGQPIVQHVAVGLRQGELHRTLLEWIEAEEECLLALDAPLGWPDALRAALPGHSAGTQLTGAPDQLFLRATDHHIWRTIGKRPLEVGADRIARAAKSATDLLAALGAALERPIPLAWAPGETPRRRAIEVYPAATLRACGITSEPYKKPEQVEARRQLLGALSDGVIAFEVEPTIMERSADALDACVCVLAGADFLAGLATPPVEKACAMREGWIWSRRPGTQPPVDN